MRKNGKIVIFLVITVIVLLLPSILLADNSATKSSYLTNPLGTTDAPKLIGRIIKAALGVVGSLALLMLTYGGFLWLTSGGAEKNITKGKQVIVWAVIGLVVIFLSYAMVDFVIKGLTKGAPSSGGQTAEDLGDHTP